MRGKITVSAPSNIAFVKYWGAADLEAVVPVNPSVSMTLSSCRTQTTAEYGIDGECDEVLVVDSDGTPGPPSAAFKQGIDRHLLRLRQELGLRGHFRVATRNLFPSEAGLASSASGFAALALAASRAAGFDADPRQLSALTRLGGSGSALRSLSGGFVQWPGSGAKGTVDLLAPASHWDLSDVIAIVEEGPKPASSRVGHERAPSSPHFATRQLLLPDRLERVRRAIAQRDLDLLGPLLEEEAIELHVIAMTSRPPIFYWRTATLDVLQAVRTFRVQGLAAFFTMDAGANVHVICRTADEPSVAASLATVPGVRRVIRDRVGEGPVVEPEHLI